MVTSRTTPSSEPSLMSGDPDIEPPVALFARVVDNPIPRCSRDPLHALGSNAFASHPAGEPDHVTRRPKTGRQHGVPPTCEPIHLCLDMEHPIWIIRLPQPLSQGLRFSQFGTLGVLFVVLNVMLIATLFLCWARLYSYLRLFIIPMIFEEHTQQQGQSDPRIFGNLSVALQLLIVALSIRATISVLQASFDVYLR